MSIPSILRKTQVGDVEISTIALSYPDYEIAETMIFLDSSYPGLVDQSCERGPGSGWLQQHQAMVEKVTAAVYGYATT